MTLNRKGLIIGNPGEKNASNFCAGVIKDYENYQIFLESDIGGAWETSEIKALWRPSVTDVEQFLKSISRETDFFFIAFCGHGGHDSSTDTTILELKSGQDFDSMKFRRIGAKRLIILDCCRVPILAKSESMSESIKKMAKASVGLDRD